MNLYRWARHVPRFEAMVNKGRRGVEKLSHKYFE